MRGSGTWSLARFVCNCTIVLVRVRSGRRCPELISKLVCAKIIMQMCALSIILNMCAYGVVRIGASDIRSNPSTVCTAGLQHCIEHHLAKL